MKFGAKVKKFIFSQVIFFVLALFVVFQIASAQEENTSQEKALPLLENSPDNKVLENNSQVPQSPDPATEGTFENSISRDENNQQEGNLKSSKDSHTFRIIFRGYLLKPDGSLTEDGLYNMKFKIYKEPAGGEPLWEEKFTGEERIEVKDSKFKVILGRKSPLNFDFENQSYYLAIQVGGSQDVPEWDKEMMPRKPILSINQFLKEQFKRFSSEDEVIKKLEELIGKQENVVLLVDINELKLLLEDVKSKQELEKRFSLENTNSDSSENENIGVLGWFKNIFREIKESIFGVFSKIQKAFELLESLTAKVEKMYREFSGTLTDISYKISAIYKVVVEGENPPTAKNKALKETLGSDFASSSSNQEFGQAVIFEGENKVRIASNKVKAESMIFISFEEAPPYLWWISEKAEGKYFVVSFDAPVNKDYKFNWWVLNSKLSDEKESTLSEEENKNTEQTNISNNHKPQEENLENKKKDTLEESSNKDNNQKETSDSLVEDLLKEAQSTENKESSPPESQLQENVESSAEENQTLPETSESPPKEELNNNPGNSSNSENISEISQEEQLTQENIKKSQNQNEISNQEGSNSSLEKVTSETSTQVSPKGEKLEDINTSDSAEPSAQGSKDNIQNLEELKF